MAVKFRTGTSNIATSQDVALSNPAADEVLAYDAGLQLWKNKPAASYSDEAAQDAVGAMVTDSSTIDFTYSDATPSLVAEVKDNSITYAKLQDVSATNRLLGRKTAGAGDVEELTAADTKTLLALTKGDVSLGNVDNTSDLTKPVSTAQQNALDLKANTSDLSSKADASAVILKSVATTKGDLLAATASATITRVGVGSDNQVLTADSTAATGLKWAAPSASANGEPKSVVATAGAAQSIDLATYSVFDLKASAATCTVTPTVTGASSSSAYAATVLLRQDATGGRSWTWPSSVTFLTGTPVYSTAANAVDTVTLITTDGGTSYIAYGPAAAASTAPASVDTHFSYPHNAGYGSTLTTNDYQVAAIFIPVACTLTGIVVLNGDVVGGSVKVGIHNATGSSLLASGSTLQTAIYQPTFVPFSSPLAVQPGKYHIGALLTSATAKVEIATTFGAKMAVNVGGGNPAPSTITVPLANDWGTPPIMSTY